MNAQHTPEAIRRKASKHGAHNPFGLIMKNSENQTPDGGPAAPTTEANGCNTGTPGMSLRDHFAVNAMKPQVGALFHSKESSAAIRECSVALGMTQSEWIATSAYQIADAMLKARQS